jgi:hypothetical protein
MPFSLLAESLTKLDQARRILPGNPRVGDGHVAGDSKAVKLEGLREDFSSRCVTEVLLTKAAVLDIVLCGR